MQTLDLIQGTPEWHEHRNKHFNASEAAAMMGESPWQSRDDLLFEKKTGITREVGDQLQRVFDRGHEVEGPAREITERTLGEDLYPETCSIELQGMKLSASLDGVTLDDKTIFEHKQWNTKDAKKLMSTGKLEPKHYWQVEQQLLVKGAEICIFVMSDGTEENRIMIEYKPVRGRAKKLIEGWKRFEADLLTYEPPETKKAEIATYEPPSLPAIEINVSTAIQSSNFDAFNIRANQFLDSIRMDLETDQDFADAEQNVKACKKAEDALIDAKERISHGNVEVSELVDMVDSLWAKIRETRLSLDKAVKAEKERRKFEIANKAVEELGAYCIELNADLNGFEVDINGNFGAAIKGLRTLDSIQSKVNDTLAEAKIRADNIAELAHTNYAAIPESAMHLFSDWPQIADKAVDDFARLVNSRISEENARIAARKEAEKAQEAAQAPQDDEIAAPATADTPETLRTQNTASEVGSEFSDWWDKTGVWVEPAPGESMEEYTRRVARMAWNAARQ